MVVQELNAAEHAQKALALLAEADAHLERGEYDSVSAKLWGAVEHAIVAVATERGWECEGDGYLGLLPIVRRLEEDMGDDRLTRGLSAASIFHNNMRYTFLEDYEIDFFTPHTGEFVSIILASLSNESNGRMTSSSY